LSNKWILSATEIDTFETCRRKWAFHYLDGIKSPASKSAELGLLVHDYLQSYLSGKSTDQETTESKIASSGLMYLPKKLPPENTERHFAFTANSHVFQGYIDFFENLGSQKWLIGDHKTCSSLSYALSPEQLKKNIQANVYAQWAFREKDAKEVILKWVYYRTKSKPKALCVETALTFDEAQRNFEPIAKAADAIKNIIAAPRNLANFPKNESACFKYGPCPFYAQCRPHSIKYKSKPTEVFTMVHASRPNAEAPKSAFHLYVAARTYPQPNSQSRTKPGSHY